MNESVDLLLIGAKELVTLAGGSKSARIGSAMRDLGIVEDGAVAIRDGRIVATGPSCDLTERFTARETIDARGRLVTPGFVDPHTHLAFASTRESEFEMRVEGKSYLEIAAAGGGIRSSVRSMREDSKGRLLERMRVFADDFIRHGTTTAEAKSGYGLRLEDELKSLEAIAELDASHPLEMIPTFLGAHEFPDEYREDRDEYVRIVAEEMVPVVAERKLAEFCDVFCEEGVYTVEQTRRVLEAAIEHGMRTRIHADEFVDSGGAELAGEMGCLSADHLMAVSDAGIAAMKRGGVTPILLPGTTFFLGKTTWAPARKLIEEGLPVAIATDFNPGSSMIGSMPFILTLACLYLRMTPAEAIVAATVNPAHSLGRGADVGSLDPGSQADLVIWDARDHRYLPYHVCGDTALHVFKKGELVYSRQPVSAG